jgi:hypothetical protein
MDNEKPTETEKPKQGTQLDLEELIKICEEEQTKK